MDRNEFAIINNLVCKCVFQKLNEHIIINHIEKRPTLIDFESPTNVGIVVSGVIKEQLDISLL